jgi:glycosyltransferase involved in cell wall biosynthesis
MKTGILFLIDQIALGGTEKQLLELIRNLDQHRIQPHLGVLHDGAPGLTKQPLPTLCLDFRAFHHFSIARSISKLSRYIRRHQIQIVQSYFQDPTLLAALSRPFHQAMLVGSFRDLGFWRNYRETLKMRAAYSAYHGFIANSRSVKSHFVETDGIDPAKVEIIHNGIPIGMQSGMSLPDSANKAPVVGIVANLNRPVKRVQDFIRAAAVVHRNCPGTRFEIIGDGHLRASLEELSRSLNLSDVLSFKGLVDNPMECIRRFRIGVITSETEGFCNAILEYMACGVPVVATATGGNLELVRENENGFLIPVADIEMLAQRISFLLLRSDICIQMGEVNFRNAEKEYSVSKMVTRHAAYYHKLLNRRK